MRKFINRSLAVAVVVAGALSAAQAIAENDSGIPGKRPVLQLAENDSGIPGKRPVLQLAENDSGIPGKRPVLQIVA